MTPRRVLDLAVASEVADSFGLGHIRVAPAVAATGWGAHNTVWRFESESGRWAVKEIGREPGRQVEAAANLEAAAHRAGITAPRPIQAGDGRWLVTMIGRVFRCHEWIGGQCPTDSLTAEDARIAGTTLAHLHGLQLPCEGGWQTACNAWGEAHWRNLVDQATSLGLDWALRLGESIDSLLMIEEAAIVYAAEQHHRIGSHCDVRPDNTLRTTTGLVLVDWDAAGPAIPGREVAQALRWWSPFEAEFIKGYTALAGDVDLGEGAGEDGGLVWWLELNVRLAIERPGDLDRQQATTWLVNECHSWRPT